MAQKMFKLNWKLFFLPYRKNPFYIQDAVECICFSFLYEARESPKTRLKLFSLSFFHCRNDSERASGDNLSWSNVTAEACTTTNIAWLDRASSWGLSQESIVRTFIALITRAQIAYWCSQQWIYIAKWRLYQTTKITCIEFNFTTIAYEKFHNGNSVRH